MASKFPGKQLRRPSDPDPRLRERRPEESAVPLAPLHESVIPSALSPRQRMLQHANTISRPHRHFDSVAELQAQKHLFTREEWSEIVRAHNSASGGSSERRGSPRLRTTFAETHAGEEGGSVPFAQIPRPPSLTTIENFNRVASGAVRAAQDHVESTASWALNNPSEAVMAAGRTAGNMLLGHVAPPVAAGLSVYRARDNILRHTGRSGVHFRQGEYGTAARELAQATASVVAPIASATGHGHVAKEAQGAGLLANALDVKLKTE